MGDIRHNNGTRFAYFSMFSSDENGRPLLTPIIKATLLLSAQGRIGIPDEQEPVNLAGTVRGDPETGSYIYEPETAFTKLATDIALIGHARPAEPGRAVVDCGIKVGSLQKIVRVFGDRRWLRKDGAIGVSRPQPFERIELCYERAFGGRDESAAEADPPQFETRNPVGTGFRAAPLAEGEAVMLPNLEAPDNLLGAPGQVVTPAGFGFVSPNWQPRVKLAGTYDAHWQKERSPLLPHDFDRRFFNAASPGLIAPGFLRGDEAVTIVNASPVPRLDFSLPGIPPPLCSIETRSGTLEVETNLDTVIVNTDEMKLFLLWRACVPLRRGPHDVRQIHISSSHPAARSRAPAA